MQVWMLRALQGEKRTHKQDGQAECRTAGHGKLDRHPNGTRDAEVVMTVVESSTVLLILSSRRLVFTSITSPALEATALMMPLVNTRTTIPITCRGAIA